MISEDKSMVANKLLAIVALLVLSASPVFAQGEIDDQSKIFYRNERTFAGLLNSNGIGFNFRYAKYIDGYKKTLYEVEFNHVKHPKEVNTSLTSGYNSQYKYGKLNTVYTLKAALGKQVELFEKYDKGAISIRYFYNFGPSIAFLKPYYYKYRDGYTTFYSKFITEENTFPPEAKAPFTKGFSELSLSPGAYVKLGMSFEFSTVDYSFHALEAGLAMDAYALPIDIIYAPSEKILFALPDDHFVLTFFISYRFGKVISQRTQKTKVDQMLVE